MSEDETIYVLSGLSPSQTAVHFALAMGGYITESGERVGAWRPARTEPNVAADDDDLWVSGEVTVNLPLDDGPPGTEQIAQDYYDIGFDLWTPIADDEFLRAEAADIFNAIVLALPWPAAHVNRHASIVSASLPDGRRVDFPDGHSYVVEDGSHFWGAYMPGEADRLAAERGRTAPVVHRLNWPWPPEPERPPSQPDVHVPTPVYPPSDRRDYDLTYALAHPGFGGRLINMFFMPGAAYPDSASVEAAESAAMHWLTDRRVIAEVDSRLSSYGYQRDLPSFEQFRRGYEFDDRGADGWGSWPAAEVALTRLGVAGDVVSALGDAFAFAQRAHEGQTRPAGEPYWVHLLEVLQVLAEGFGSRDRDQLLAAVLHDVVEDTPVTLEEVAARFGGGVAELVGWVTMPPFTAEDRARVRAEYLAHLKDAPPVVRQLKLADRYSNVQRLHTHPRPEKQRSYAAETVQHFVPLTLKEKTFFLPLFLAWMRRTPVLAGETPPYK